MQLTMDFDLKVKINFYSQLEKQFIVLFICSVESRKAKIF